MLTVAHSQRLRAGRAGSPLPAAIANPRVRIRHDGAHGVTRPTFRASGVDGGRPAAAFSSVTANCVKSGLARSKKANATPK